MATSGFSSQGGIMSTMIEMNHRNGSYGIAESWWPILSLRFHNNCSESPSTLLCHKCDCDNIHGIQSSGCREKGCFNKRGNRFHRIRPEGEPQWYTCHDINSEEQNRNECHETGCFTKLYQFIDQERNSSIPICPSTENVFRWTKFCSPDEVKVVILGQDPYHTAGQATGLAFSVEVGFQPAVSSIYKALEIDASREDSSITFQRPGHGNLTGWAKQGVLLLNAVLTVRQGDANSHAGKGWEQITDGVIKYISDNYEGVVFMLWGGPAKMKRPLVNESEMVTCRNYRTERHCVLDSSHPTSWYPDCEDFHHCRHFSKANGFLWKHGRDPIDWNYL